MSKFCVSIEAISEVKAHPNADSLDLSVVASMTYQFVTGRGSVAPGDLVIYFPIDSELPEAVKAHLPEAIVKKLHGKARNRIKTAKLRGEISQGLALKLNEFPLQEFGIENFFVGQDITAQLGVTKYEPPIVAMGGYDLHALPQESPYYDIEGCDRNQAIVNQLMDELVVITEKIEGTNHSCVGRHDLTVEVCQRSGSIKLHEGAVNPYWHAAIHTGTLGALHDMVRDNSGINPRFTIRSELIGEKIQGNYYDIKGLDLYTFEICLDGEPVDWVTQKELMFRYGLKSVPILFEGTLRDFLAGETIQKKSNGMSVLNPKKRREGIVIRPQRERTLPGFGRVILKQRSPEYLAETDF